MTFNPIFILDLASVIVFVTMSIQDYKSCEVDTWLCVLSTTLSLVYCLIDYRPIGLILISVMLVLIILGKELPKFGLADLCIPANIIGAFGCRIDICLDLIICLVMFLIGLILYKLFIIIHNKWSSKPFALVPMIPGYLIMLPLTYIITNLISNGVIDFELL